MVERGRCLDQKGGEADGAFRRAARRPSTARSGSRRAARRGTTVANGDFALAYRIIGLDPAPFRPLYGLSDADLAARGAIRYRVDAAPGFPCRVTLEDVADGETVLLLNHEHHPAETPYRARHAIFVLEGAEARAAFEDQVPEALARRLLSVRAFDAEGMMTDADVVEGAALEPLIERLFADPETAVLHVHNAKRGCFAASVDRGSRSRLAPPDSGPYGPDYAAREAEGQQRRQDGDQ